LRFSAGEKKKVLAILTQLQKDLRVKLLGDLTDFGKARVNKLLKEATSVIDAAYKEIAPGVIDPLISEAKMYKSAAEFVEAKAIKAKLIESGIKVNADNTVTLYHATSRNLAKKITKEGLFKGGATAPGGMTGLQLEPSVFFGTNKKWTKETWGVSGEVLEVRVPVQFIRQPAENTLEVYFEGGLKKGADGIWRPTQAVRSTFYDKIAKIEMGNEEELASAWKSATSDKSTDMLGLARSEATATAQSFIAIGLDAALPTEAALKALVNDALIEGAPIKKWWLKQADNTAFFFNSAVRQEYQTAVSRGMSLNETVQQIVRRVIGSPRLGTPGIMETSRRGATALVHTSIQQVANDARLATFKANDDVVKGVMQLSTLDSHTTKICIAYSGASWDLDGNPINGNTLPFNGGTPRHWNCRSVLTAITFSYKELGIDIPEAPPGTRASDLGQIPADTSFESFLGRHDKAYVDNLLGPGRADLWRDGKITLQQLVGGDGRELTLKRLKAL